MSDTEPYKKLLQLSEAAIMDNQQGIGFAIETHEGEKLKVCCSLAEIGDIFSFLGGIAKQAAAQDASLAENAKQPSQYLAPIPAMGMGFQAGQTPDETLLVMNCFGFWVAFAVPSAGLKEVAAGFSRTAQTLSASGKPT